ncbi:MAG: coproporphyrinogen III oxidase family protein [Chloroflexi bacterium]|nr:coproporphyrinogen III oxidase family protein [Chloroflexota bacterium]
MSAEKIERRNIHTYPFKYTHTPAEEFFASEKAAIYVHIPFCTKRCHFCDYVVRIGSNSSLREQYVDAVCKEIRQFRSIPCFPSFLIDALYVGGGTPGLLESRQLTRILKTCQDTFAFTEDAEISIEFDPRTARLDKLIEVREAGFNRLSLGLQTFDQHLLYANNRPHTVEDIYEAYDAIASARFVHTNVDILYPLLDQKMEQWEETVQKAIALKPAAITAYPLEVWSNSAYGKWLANGRKTVGWALEEAMSRYAYDRLEDAGFQRNTTGGYYHPGRARRYCRYGDYYWRTWPLIGFGVSAKSVIHDRLYTNMQDVEEYIRRIQDGQPVIDFSTRLTRRQEMRRVMIRGLKLCKVAKSEFRDRFGVAVDVVFGSEIATLVEARWIHDRADCIELTREGQVYDRSVYAVFYTEEDIRPPREGEVQYGLSDPVADCDP